MEEEYARTRKQLMNGLWNRGLTNFEIFKEGPFYACMIGKRIYAAGIRQINCKSVAWWADKIRQKYFPI